MPQKPGDESEGLWGKLRQRKVVQWGIAYVAAGWGLLQGLAYVGTAFHWSDQLQRIAIVAFFVGLPIALVVAWYHGDRGHQRVGGREFAILTVLLLIGGGLFWWVGRMPDNPVLTATAQAPAAPANEPSIAALPFVNMSDDKGATSTSPTESRKSCSTYWSAWMGLAWLRAPRPSATRAARSARRRLPGRSRSITFSKAACASPAITCASPRS